MKRIIIMPEELEILQKGIEEIKQIIRRGHPQINDPILTTDDVMNLLKVSRRTLQKYRDSALIEFSAVEGKFFYKLSSIERMIDKHSKKEGVL